MGYSSAPPGLAHRAEAQHLPTDEIGVTRTTASLMSDKVVHTVGVSDMKIGKAPNTSLITYALGSCIAVVAYDSAAKVGGMLHFQLPESKPFEAQAAENPYKFGDTGIAALFEQLYALGAQKNRMVIGIFGGANMMRDEHVFQIGIRNTRTAKKMLWQNSLFIKFEDVGGTTNRTVSLDLDTGRMKMKKDGEVFEY
jgi:chemotaxis protein CheD